MLEDVALAGPPGRAREARAEKEEAGLRCQSPHIVVRK
jgi:hypothetical protein